MSSVDVLGVGANSIDFVYALPAYPRPDGPLSKPNVDEYAFYAQDSWRVNDALTLNYGVRYDLFKYANPSVQNPNAALLAASVPVNIRNCQAVFCHQLPNLFDDARRLLCD